MGIKLPQPIEYCEWDNDLWPPGETPKIILAEIAGNVWNGPNMPPEYPPINGTFKLVQMSAVSWYYDSPKIECLLYLSTGYTQFGMGWKPIGGTTFAAFSLISKDFFLINEFQPPDNRWVSGICALYPAIEMNESADELAISMQPKSFAEIVGRDLRLAQRQQGTCVYYRKA